MLWHFNHSVSKLFQELRVSNIQRRVFMSAVLWSLENLVCRNFSVSAYIRVASPVWRVFICIIIKKTEISKFFPSLFSLNNFILVPAHALKFPQKQFFFFYFILVQKWRRKKIFLSWVQKISLKCIYACHTAAQVGKNLISFSIFVVENKRWTFLNALLSVVCDVYIFSNSPPFNGQPLG